MNKTSLLRNQEGFTLVEIIAVLIILGILAAVAVPRYIDLEENARSRAIDAAVSELNGRESLTWADAKISGSAFATGTALDQSIINEMSTNLNREGQTDPDYTWGGGGRTAGASSNPDLTFRGDTVTLTRNPATLERPGTWIRP